MTKAVPFNLHTHTTFCDGADTPQALVEEAIRLGCPKIGFSGHAYTPFDSDFCMSLSDTQAYVETVRNLQQQYKNKIEILLGVEQDFFSPMPTDVYDFVIGSVHYVKTPDGYLSVDDTKEILTDGVNRYFGGDYYALCEAYYHLVAQVYKKTRCDIIGHLDLVTKFNEGDAMFSTEHPRYKNAVKSAINKLKNTGATFEINTGAVARGYRTEPYPQKWILSILQQNQVALIRTSDCHQKEKLLFGL